MSDFYRSKRIAIKDTTALLTFFIGFVWSGAFVWRFMEYQIDQGDMTRGLAYFLGAVLACAIVTGLIGLEAGNLVGGVWEKYHKIHRGPALVGAASAFSPGRLITPQPVAVGRSQGSSGALASTRAAHNILPVDPAKDISGVYYTDSGVYAASYLALAQRVRPEQYELSRTREALATTKNFGAWDNGRLVGAARVLTDGYMVSVLADIIVDPDYQRLGIGRALMARALGAAPDGRLRIESAPDCAGFFTKMGCEPGHPEFVLVGASTT